MSKPPKLQTGGSYTSRLKEKFKFIFCSHSNNNKKIIIIIIITNFVPPQEIRKNVVGEGNISVTTNSLPQPLEVGYMNPLLSFNSIASHNLR